MIEVVVKNKTNSPVVFLGICQSNVMFEKLFMEILNVELDGVPWLVFEKLCKYFRSFVKAAILLTTSLQELNN